MDKPAILGGKPSVAQDAESFRQSQRWPVLGTQELGAIERLFQDANISTHPVIRELESAYAAFSGREHALAHNNGTSALWAAYWSLGLEPGDKVLVPTATFWASVLPMMWLGLVPVFCESDGATLGMDLADMESKLDRRTKAMVIVPLWGFPCDYDALLGFAARHDLRVIEDASHAHGATWKGRPCGSFGDVSVFSLQGDKLAPAGEGGVFLTNDRALWERAQLLGDITRIVELPTADRRFAATSFGLKTRIAPVSAAIGIEQLKKLGAHNEIRKTNLAPLSRALSRFGFETYADDAQRCRVYFEFLVRHLDGPLDVEGWREALVAEGCQAGRPRYPLLHQQPFFREGRFAEILRLPDSCPLPDYSSVHLPRTQALNDSLLKLPHFPNPAQELVSAYLDAIEKIGEHQEEIAAFRAGRP
jgi:perosamine synthetase